MRRFWVILAFALGVAIAAGVWFWPDGPLWSAAVEADEQFLRFGPEAGRVYTAIGRPAQDGAQLNVVLRQWDANTGQLQASTPFACADPGERINVYLSPDAKTLVAGAWDRSAGGQYHL